MINKIFRIHKSTKVWMTHKNIPQTRKKTKITFSYIKSVSVVSNSLGLILVSIAIQCRILFWLRKIYRNLVLVEASISELKDEVNYNFLEGAKFPKRGPYFLGNMARGGQIFGGAKFPVTPAPDDPDKISENIFPSL